MPQRIWENTVRSFHIYMEATEALEAAFLHHILKIFLAAWAGTFPSTNTALRPVFSLLSIGALPVRADAMQDG
jgi:hypothetical protein